MQRSVNLVAQKVDRIQMGKNLHKMPPFEVSHEVGQAFNKMMVGLRTLGTDDDDSAE